MAFQKTTKYHQNRIISICEGIKGTIDNISTLEDYKAIQAHISQALSYSSSLKAKLEEFERFEKESKSKMNHCDHRAHMENFGW